VEWRLVVGEWLARVNGAGHMVPWDKPVEALQMFKAWLNKKTLT
jgi:carboxypeptidase C (cathepsin A)